MAIANHTTDKLGFGITNVAVRKQQCPPQEYGSAPLDKDSGSALLALTLQKLYDFTLTLGNDLINAHEDIDQVPVIGKQ